MGFTRPHVVVSITDEQQEFQRYQAADARATAQRLGYDVDVFFAERSAVQQTQQLYSVLERPAERRRASAGCC
jgi:ABC-type xylose transport system substrate-binding protein